MSDEHSTFSLHSSWAAPPLIAGDWRDLELVEAAPLLIRLVLRCAHPSARTMFLDHWPTRVRAMRPSFYPGWILAEVQAALADGSIGLCDFLYGPHGSILIDGASSTLHWLNAQGAQSFGENTSTVADYLRFFCSAVHGDQGRFQIVESIDSLPPPPIGGQTPSIETPVNESFPPVQIRRDGDGFVAKAIVLYGSSLFSAEFTIGTDGTINMTKDVPLAVLPVPGEEFRLPFRVVGGERGSAPGSEPSGQAE